MVSSKQSEMICFAVPSNILLLLSKFLRTNIGEGRTATTAVLAIFVSSLRRCAPEWSCWRMGQTNYWTRRNFQKLSFEFPKWISSYRCQGQLSLWWYKKQFLRHLHRCQYAAPKKNCCPKISSTFTNSAGKELKDSSGSCWSFSTDSSIWSCTHTHHCHYRNCHGRCSSLKWQLLRHN